MKYTVKQQGAIDALLTLANNLNNKTKTHFSAAEFLLLERELGIQFNTKTKTELKKEGRILTKNKEQLLLTKATQFGDYGCCYFPFQHKPSQDTTKKSS